MDVHLQLQSDDGTIPEDCAAARWGDFMLQAAERLGRPLDSMTFYRKQMLDAGFTNVTERLLKWPTNSWPKDPKFKELGTSPSTLTREVYERPRSIRNSKERETAN